MTAVAATDDRVRHRIRVAGVVQGVGFRPFVHRLATELDLAGHVGNDSEGVFVEVEGLSQTVERFELRVVEEAPPLAVIHRIEATAVEPVGDHGFRIERSRSAGTARTFVSPDIAVCDACLDEMFDPGDRRYRYPFINCTNCGPRFTITIRLPYDRPNTTMAGFAMLWGVRRGVPRREGPSLSRATDRVCRLRASDLVRSVEFDVRLSSARSWCHW